MIISRILNFPRFANLHSVATVLNPIQEQSLKENCLLVDTNDKVIGTASKKECHQVGGGENLLLHRAFSVFLFNTKKELLLQKRSASKITFPNCYTNTCCSHPLHDFHEECIEEQALGIKHAAIRRLNHELGIPKEELSLSDLTYLTRIIYKSVGDGVWGEYEIDYLLFIKKEVTVLPNPEEVSEISYVPKHRFDSFISNLKDPLTPWFNLIVSHKLKLWWDNLDSLDKFMDHVNIHSFNDHTAQSH